MTTFKETFIEVGRRSLAPENKQRQDYVYSVGIPVTALMVLAGALYYWTPMASIVVLSCAIILMWGRWVILRQVTTDLSQMRASKQMFRKERNKDYLQFIQLRGEQMLRDNKALTPLAKQEITELIEWASQQH